MAVGQHTRRCHLLDTHAGVRIERTVLELLSDYMKRATISNHNCKSVTTARRKTVESTMTKSTNAVALLNRCRSSKSNQIVEP